MIRVGFILFFIIFLSGCSSVKTEIIDGFKIRTERKERISITGIAGNSKGGAVVITDDESIYYIGNKDEWNEKCLDKRVKVSGRLILITKDKLDDNREAGYLPSKNWLKRTRVVCRRIAYRQTKTK